MGDRVWVERPGRFSFTGKVIGVDGAYPVERPMVWVQLERRAGARVKMSYPYREWVEEAACRVIGEDG